MTKKNALETAIAALVNKPTAEDDDMEAIGILTKMVEQLSKARPVNEEKKAAVSAARKEKTAQARAELVAKVAPVLREVLTHTLQGLTAKEIYGEAASRLPADFTVAKVQNVLLREMRPELNVTEAKGKANIYTLKSVVD